MASQNDHHMHAAKNFIAFMLVAIAAAIFFVFYHNQDNIIDGNNMGLFYTLAVLGAGFLVGLLYLVSNSSHSSPAKPSKSASKSKKKKK